MRPSHSRRASEMHHGCQAVQPQNQYISVAGHGGRQAAESPQDPHRGAAVGAVDFSLWRRDRARFETCNNAMWFRRPHCSRRFGVLATLPKDRSRQRRRRGQQALVGSGRHRRAPGIRQSWGRCRKAAAEGQIGRCVDLRPESSITTSCKGAEAAAFRGSRRYSWRRSHRFRKAGSRSCCR